MGRNSSKVLQNNEECKIEESVYNDDALYIKKKDMDKEIEVKESTDQIKINEKKNTENNMSIDETKQKTTEKSVTEKENTKASENEKEKENTKESENEKKGETIEESKSINENENEIINQSEEKENAGNAIINEIKEKEKGDVEKEEKNGSSNKPKTSENKTFKPRGKRGGNPVKREYYKYKYNPYYRDLKNLAEYDVMKVQACISMTAEKRREWKQINSETDIETDIE